VGSSTVAAPTGTTLTVSAATGATLTAASQALSGATPTATAMLSLRIAAQLDPPMPRAGLGFVLQLSIANDGNRAARGGAIGTSGPWDRWTVLGIDPAANFARDATGWRIISDVQIPPRQSRSIDLHVRADSPSEDQVTFAVREADAGELR